MSIYLFTHYNKAHTFQSDNVREDVVGGIATFLGCQDPLLDQLAAGVSDEHDVPSNIFSVLPSKRVDLKKKNFQVIPMRNDMDRRCPLYHGTAYVDFPHLLNCHQKISILYCLE